MYGLSLTTDFRANATDCVCMESYLECGVLGKAFSSHRNPGHLGVVALQPCPQQRFHPFVLARDGVVSGVTRSLVVRICADVRIVLGGSLGLLNQTVEHRERNLMIL